MERVISWAELLAVLAPHDFPDAARRRGRSPIGLERMLRMHFLRQWCALADEALAEKSLHRSILQWAPENMYQMAPDLSPPSRSAGRSIAGLCDCWRDQRRQAQRQASWCMI